MHFVRGILVLFLVSNRSPPALLFREVRGFPIPTTSLSLLAIAPDESWAAAGPSRDEDVNQAALIKIEKLSCADEGVQSHCLASFLTF